MSDAREVLHDDDPHDPHAWQPVATLAAAIGIAERTVRARLAAGTVERCAGPGGRSYYRVPPAAPSASAADGNDAPAGSRQLAAAELFALIREHGSRNERLALELGQARAASCALLGAFRSPLRPIFGSLSGSPTQHRGLG